MFCVESVTVSLFIRVCDISAVWYSLFIIALCIGINMFSTFGGFLSLLFGDAEVIYERPGKREKRVS